MWWCMCIQCFTTGNTLSVKTVIRSLCSCNHVFVIVVLLCCAILHSIHHTGADKDAKDNHERTPLMEACWYGHREVAAALLEHGELLC